MKLKTALAAQDVELQCGTWHGRHHGPKNADCPAVIGSPAASGETGSRNKEVTHCFATTIVTWGTSAPRTSKRSSYHVLATSLFPNLYSLAVLSLGPPGSLCFGAALRPALCVLVAGRSWHERNVFGLHFLGLQVQRCGFVLVSL